jgi:hypothetical protein
MTLDFWRLPPVRSEQVLVGVTAKQVCETRSELQPRLDLAIANVSATKGTDLVYIKLGSDGIATTTDWVLDVGDTLTISGEQGFPCHQDTVTAICTTANGKINILER